jgi:transcriptional regulator of arginine metabolism
VTEKQRRRSGIRRLLQETVVSSQDQLVALLNELGVVCTQATLSRDLRDMGVTRERTADGGHRYVVDPRARYLTALREVVGMEVLQVRHNGSLIVVRTLSGRAGGVAAFLDEQQDPRILGTLAGDDTVFIAPADTAGIDSLMVSICAISDGG